MKPCSEFTAPPGAHICSKCAHVFTLERAIDFHKNKSIFAHVDTIFKKLVHADLDVRKDPTVCVVMLKNLCPCNSFVETLTSGKQEKI